jgi:hypothetical protein
MTDIAWLVAIDAGIPLVAAVALIALTSRGGGEMRRHIRFWGTTALYVGFIASVAIFGATSVNSSHGYGVLAAVFVALPMSIPAAIIHQTAAWNLHVELHPDIALVFAASLICWTLVNALTLRLILQSAARRAARNAASRSISPHHNG